MAAPVVPAVHGLGDHATQLGKDALEVNAGREFIDRLQRYGNEQASDGYGATALRAFLMRPVTDLPEPHRAPS